MACETSEGQAKTPCSNEKRETDRLPSSSNGGPTLPSPTDQNVVKVNAFFTDVTPGTAAATRAARSICD